MHQHRLTESGAAPGAALEINRGFHMHKRQRDELGEATGLLLQLANAQKVSRPMLVVLDMAEHDGCGAAQAAAMGGTHHVEPASGVDLVGAEHGAHLIIEDFRRRARKRAQPRGLQRAQKRLEREPKGRGALMHFEGGEGVHVDAGRGAFHRLANLNVCGSAVTRMNAALHAHFARATLPGLTRAARDLGEREFVGPATKILAHLAFRESAEAAFEVTDVGVVDVARDHVRDGLTIAGLPQFVGGRADRRKLVPATAKQPHDVGFTERDAGLGPCQDRGEFIADYWSAEAGSTIGKAGAGAGGPCVRARPSVSVDAAKQRSPQRRIDPFFRAASECRIDRQPFDQLLAGCICGLCERIQSGPRRLWVDMIRRDRRHAAPIIDACIDQA